VNDDRFKIFSGTANPVLAESICRHLDVPLGKALLGRFSDGEIYFQILENVRGADVFRGAALPLSGGQPPAGIAADD